MFRKPYLDLRPVNSPFLQGFEEDLAHCIADNAYIGGKGVEAFEEAYAQFIGAEHCIGVGNGTDALFLILKALDIGMGDDVLVQAHTCDATWMAIGATGARPIPVDVRYETLNLNPELLDGCITPNTKAVIAVHMNGSPVEVEDIQVFCKKNSIHFIEDNAQATGAKYKGKKTGSFGIAAGHSFYPTKPLGAIGDGGAVTTNDGMLAEKIRSLANYGKRAQATEPRIMGFNSRLDDLQARFLLRKLPYVEELIADRKAVFEAYKSELAHLPVQFQYILPSTNSAYHLCTILHSDRDRLRQDLALLGIDTLIHYPQAPHQLAPFVYDDKVAPVAARIARETLSLPL